MKFIKLYGPKRSCTNYLKWTLETNFEDCTVLMRILGSKHSVHKTHPTWDPEEFLDPGQPRGPQIEYLSEVLPQVREAWEAQEIQYLIVTKHPLACARGSLRRWKKAQKLFDSEPEQFIRDYSENWNRSFSSWFSLIDGDAKATLVRCEDMYRDFTRELDRLADFFGLQPCRDDAYLIPRRKLNALSDATWKNPLLRQVSEGPNYVLQQQYLDEWSQDHTALWKELLNRSIMERLGYSC